jgi:hypothetical protein
MKWRDTNDERQDKILHRETQTSYYFEQKIGQNQKSMKRSLVTVAKTTKEKNKNTGIEYHRYKVCNKDSH